MMLLALSGRKQSGKDSIGNFLVRNTVELFGIKEHDPLEAPKVRAKKYGWADPLKRMVGDLFKIPDEWLWGTDEDKNRLTTVKWKNLPHWSDPKYMDFDRSLKKQNKYLTVRELLQQFGTEIVRRMNPDAWVNASMAKIEREKPNLVVFIDTRFPNEVAAIKERGGKVVRLTRKEDEVAKHESEWALDKDKYDWSNFDVVIDNKSMSVDEQNKEMVKLLEDWGWKK